MPNAENYIYVYVNDDGTAREVHPEERKYLETEFLPGDGGAPNVKDRYDEHNGWGEICGYLERSKLPETMPVQKAPKENPMRPMNATEFAEWLRSKGVKVTVRKHD